MNYTTDDMLLMKEQSRNEGYNKGAKDTLFFIVFVVAIIALVWYACAGTVGM